MLNTVPRPSESNDAAEDRRLALAYVADAMAEAVADGVEEDCFVQAALFVAIQSLVSTYGEDAAACFTERLPERIRRGEFTVAVRH